MKVKKCEGRGREEDEPRDIGQCRNCVGPSIDTCTTSSSLQCRSTFVQTSSTSSDPVYVREKVQKYCWTGVEQTSGDKSGTYRRRNTVALGLCRVDVMWTTSTNRHFVSSEERKPQKQQLVQTKQMGHGKM